MSMRKDLIDKISMNLGTEYTPTRDQQMPATMLYDLRDTLELDKDLETRRAILTELKNQEIIDTNQIYTDTKHRLGVDELKQLYTHLQERPRGIERARNKFKKVADE